MGLCSSKQTPADKAANRRQKLISKQIENQNNNDQECDGQINKLLLLGAGESGKSTLFKQMISIYGKGFSEADRKGYTSIIYNNIVLSIKVLIEQTEKLDDEKCRCSEDVLPNKEYIEGLKPDAPVDEEVAVNIAALWKDNGVQECFAQKSKFQLNDSANYYFDKIHEIAQPGYIPTEQDVLRSRVRTTGIVENEFDIEGNLFRMYDVGGQRNERKKWIHCFEKVTAVIFVAAISEYDQVLYEDEDTNRMHEALNLFEEICNSRWFRETAMILFLNKRDLFETKILKVSLTDCFPEYDGGPNYDTACEFIQFEFEDKNRNPDKQVYTHITCATDTNNVKHVFQAVKDIVIRKSLNEAGLV